MATDNFWGAFRRWRRHRPFWGGLIIVLSAVELFLSANMTLGGLEVHLGPQGFLSYLLPILLLVSGLLCWFSPAQRMFYGIVALLTALYSFVGLNLGGFFVGMLLGIVGGALVIAWGPPRRPLPAAPAAGTADSPTADSPTADSPTADIPTTDIPAANGISTATGTPVAEGTPTAADAAEPFGASPGHSQAFKAQADQADEPLLPGMQEEQPRRRRFGKNPKTLAVGLIALTVTGSLLVAGSRTPASADDCPEGLPSRSTATTAAPRESTSKARASTAAARHGATSSGAKSSTATSPAAHASSTPAAKSKPAGSTAAPTGTATAGAASADQEDSGNPVLDGIKDIAGGVGNLLGIDGAKSSPSASPTPSQSPTAAVTPTTAGPTSAATKPSTGSPATTPAAGSVRPTSAAPAQPGTAAPAPSGSTIPCLGARLFGKTASAKGLPVVAEKPGQLKVDSLTMYDSSYDGTVNLPTASGGTIKALKFSMDKAVNKGFDLRMDEKNGGQTVILSKKLTTDRNVRFYTTRFSGRLFGLIPITFTPSAPPPLTLPVLHFTNVKIQLTFLSCDKLTAEPMDLSERS